MAKAIKKVIQFIKSIIIIPGIIIMLFSCENRIEDVKAISGWNNLPMITASDIEILYSDSGLVKARIVSAELHEYEKTEDKGEYVEFTKGVEVYFYNDQKEVESKLSSRYAIYDKAQKLFEARVNVVVENFETNEKLNTEQLFWDENKSMIFSDKFVKITKHNEDGNDDVRYGENGFEADPNFSSYVIKGGGGVYHSKDNS